MDDTPTDAMSVQEAKARLLAAGEAASPERWIRRHPLGTLFAAALLGVAVARLPHARLLTLATHPVVRGLLLSRLFPR